MKINEYIDSLNKKNQKVLSIFLTGGYPQKDIFVSLVTDILDAGADMIEIGFPFSDPLADGPIIQNSSQNAIKNGVNLYSVLQYTSQIKGRTDKPVILMGYANPVLNYGIKNFFTDAINAGADGLIIPDIPIEEYSDFYGNCEELLDIILLATPGSSVSRVNEIDRLSRGFVYSVSVNGTTGEKTSFDTSTLLALQKNRAQIKRNKMLVGFGIANPESIIAVSPFCDGVIVGSAVIKKINNCNNNYGEVFSFVNGLKSACMF